MSVPGLEKRKTRDLERRQGLLEKIEQRTEMLLLVLSFVMIPLLVGPLLWDLSRTEDRLFVTLDVFVWALFAIDLAVKTAVAPDRWRYLRQHWIDVLVVVVPFLRPLRLVRLVVYGSRAFVGVKRLVKADFILLYGLGMIIIAATVEATVEGESPDSTITSFSDALWWSVVTITTVGYGDMTPLTPAGRAIAFVLMVVGVGLFGGLTANLASFLVKEEKTDDIPVSQLAREIRNLREEIGELRRAQA
jgi:voltage-gated potassium channel